MYTVLEKTDRSDDAERFWTVAQDERSWAAGEGSERDQESYQRALRQAADPAFSPELLFAPTGQTSDGWWMIDGIHRAAALLTTRAASGATTLMLPVYVLSLPLL